MRRAFIVTALAAVLAALWLAAEAADSPDTNKPVSSPGLAAGGQPALAAKKGIAALYLGDEGIEQNPAVVFHEDFETGAIEDLGQRWTNILDPNYSVLWYVPDSVPGSPGKRSLRMTGTKGRDTGGHLWKLLSTGYDQLYARYYTKFAPDAPYVHHFVAMGGRMNSPNYPIGAAGTRPEGSDRFGSTVDLGYREVANPPGAWFFYTYWCEMRSWQTPEGVSDGRPDAFYGNPFGPVQLEQAPRDKWVCVEFMIKCNSAPDKRDGEQAFWIDGRLIGRYGPGTITGTWFRDTFHQSGYYNTNPQPFEGFRWRKTNDLKINIFWLQYYLAHVFENDYNPHNPDIPYNDNVARVYFDDIVLATEYIGPLATEPPGPGCDVNGDGNANVIDVIRLVQLCLKNPQDPRADYNGDGSATIADAIALLIDIIEGNC